VPPACIPDVFQGVCHANHIRKMQASFSWDWGPAFPSSGIWLPIRLALTDHPRVQYITWVVEEAGLDWSITATAILRLPAGPGTAALSWSLGPGLGSTTSLVEWAGGEGEHSWQWSTRLPRTDVERWWPNGAVGTQRLYDLTVGVSPADRGSLVDSLTRRVAFRTVQLIQEPLAADIDVKKGLTFFFKINGEPIFMKGSNWIPAHVLPEQVNPFDNHCTSSHDTGDPRDPV
jgi:beta-mannosidase